MKSQIELAKEKGIEVGCRVKVVRKYEGEDWDNTWVEEMDKCIGIYQYVGRVDEYGITLGMWTFPVQSLEKVEEITFAEAIWDANRVHISVHMTKREYFAAMAMQGLCANPHWNSIDIDEEAVRYADALIAELNKGEEV